MYVYLILITCLFSILYSAACALITLSNQMIMRWFGKCTGPRLLGEKYAASLKSFMWLKNNGKEGYFIQMLG